MKKYFFIIASLILTLSFILLIFFSCAKEEVGKISITTDSKDALKDFIMGRDLIERLQGQESLKHFEQAIQKDSAFAMAYLYYSFNQPTADGFFEQLKNAVKLKDRVSDGERLWIEGVDAGSKGFPMKQRELYEQLVAAYPNDERAHNLLATNYFGTQEYERAIEEYQKATVIKPEFSPPYNQMGYAYRFLEKYDEAENAFQKYIELIPNDPNPYDSYAELLMKIGKYDESIEQYQKALEINPNFVASHIGIATNCNFKSEYEKARAQLQNLFYIARDDGEKRAARFAMTVSFVDEGQMDKAIEEIKWQYSLGKNANDAANMSADMVFMGNVYFEMKEYDKAIEKFEKAIKIMEESDLSQEVKDNAKRNFLYNSARVALKKKKIKDAKSKADEFMKQTMAVNNTFQIWLAHELVGRIAMKAKEYQKAIDEYNQANLQNPYNLYRLAKAYDAAGNKEMAKKYFVKTANHNTLNSLQYAFCRHKAKEKLEKM